VVPLPPLAPFALPEDAPLRQFTDDATEPMGTLLGYFAGGIDKGAE
jgi:hypothetical protein